MTNERNSDRDDDLMAHDGFEAQIDSDDLHSSVEDELPFDEPD